MAGRLPHFRPGQGGGLTCWRWVLTWCGYLLFTGRELDYCRSTPQSFRFESLAARFAAKEAVLKSLQVGLYDLDGVSFRDIEVVSAACGAPGLELSGPILKRAQELNLIHWSLSLSHSNEYALACVVGAGPFRQQE